MGAKIPFRQYLILILLVLGGIVVLNLCIPPTSYPPLFGGGVQSELHQADLQVVQPPRLEFTDLRRPVATLPKNWVSHNEIAIQALFQCMQNADCGQNQTKIVLLQYHPFIDEIQETHEGGEVIWARSTVRALERLGYTFIYSPNNDRAIQLYHIFRGLITAIFTEESDVNGCYKDPKCIQSAKNPSGIPLWKLFAWNWWTGAVGPLKNKWTMNPEDYQLEGKGFRPNNYLGYSVEPACSARPFVPHSERKRQAYVLAKEMSYFVPKQTAWASDFYDDAHKAADVEFVSGVRGQPTPDFPSRLTNLGYMTPSDFYDHLSHSLVLVGVGSPLTSPTPYDALCFGVPFINPIVDWDRKDPQNRNRWNVQHGMMKHLDPPYVYHVFKGDRDGFVKAIKDAVEHPIQSYVLDRMKMEAVMHRLGNILNTDWEAEALAISS